MRHPEHIAARMAVALALILGLVPPATNADDIAIIVTSLEAANSRFPRRVATTTRIGAVQSTQTIELVGPGEGHFQLQSPARTLDLYVRNSVAYIRTATGWDKTAFAQPRAIRESLDWLRLGITQTAHDVQSVGQEVVDGVATTRYRMNVRYHDAAGEYQGTVHLWIADDAEHLPLRSTFEGTYAAQATVVEMRAAYGAAVTVAFPADVGGM